MKLRPRALEKRVRRTEQEADLALAQIAFAPANLPPLTEENKSRDCFHSQIGRTNRGFLNVHDFNFVALFLEVSDRCLSPLAGTSSRGCDVNHVTVFGARLHPLTNRLVIHPQDSYDGKQKRRSDQERQFIGTVH